jgi:hypothetical protein
VRATPIQFGAAAAAPRSLWQTIPVLVALRYAASHLDREFGMVGQMVNISVVHADLSKHACDLLILKHADGFHGVDARVSAEIDFRDVLKRNEYVVVSGKHLAAKRVLYVGVGPLNEFRYARIREFASLALQLAAESGRGCSIIGSPMHGTGYGLDEKEAFLSLVGGFVDALERRAHPKELERIEIVEVNQDKAQRLAKLLADFIRPSENSIDPRRIPKTAALAANVHDNLSSFGAGSELKSKLFVAMPFAETHSDVWDIAIQEACAAVDLRCERIDESAFTGSIVDEIRRSLTSCQGLIALLDDANPNVFLEIGYAWALNKPTIFLARNPAGLPFDVKGHRCILYKSINGLRADLRDELGKLKKNGVFA